MARRYASIGDFTERLAPWLLALVFSHPLLIWPLIEGVAFDPAQDLIATGLDQPSGPLNQLFFPPLAILLVVIQTLRSGRPWPPLNAVVVLSLLFLVWAILSTLWSVEPEITLRRVILYACVMVCVVWPTAMMADARGGILALFWVLFVAALVNIWAVLTVPPTFLGHAGIYPHKNGLGIVAALMVLLAIWGLIAGTWKERLASVPMFALGVLYLVLSKSKTSLGLALLSPVLAGGAVWVARYLRCSPAISIPGGVGGIFLVYLFGAQAAIWDFHAVADALFGDPTLTLRTDIWRFAWSMAEARPLTGYGYEVFWGAGAGSPNQVYGEGFIRKMVHAHNGYLDLIVHLGWIGLSMVMAILLVVLHQAHRRSTSEPGVAFGQLLIVIFLIVYNLLEAAWLRSFTISSMALLLAIGQSVVPLAITAPHLSVAVRRHTRRRFKRYRWQPASAG